jgi:RNA-binding protein
MTLTEKQKKHLRGLGHKLKPVVHIGDAGLTEAVRKEFDSTIRHHELIKVRVRSGDRESRDDIIRRLCDGNDTALVSRIGNIALLYRPNEDKPRISLPRG